MRESLRLLSLLSILVDKGVLSKAEVSEARTVGDVIELLVHKNLISRAEAAKSLTDIKEVLQEAKEVFRKGSVSNRAWKRLERWKTRFPKLIEYLLEELGVKGQRPN